MFTFFFYRSTNVNGSPCKCKQNHIKCRRNNKNLNKYFKSLNLEVHSSRNSFITNALKTKSPSLNIRICLLRRWSEEKKLRSIIECQIKHYAFVAFSATCNRWLLSFRTGEKKWNEKFEMETAMHVTIS